HSVRALARNRGSDDASLLPGKTDFAARAAAVPAPTDHRLPHRKATPPHEPPRSAAAIVATFARAPNTICPPRLARCRLRPRRPAQGANAGPAAPGGARDRHRDIVALRPAAVDRACDQPADGGPEPAAGPR